MREGVVRLCEGADLVVYDTMFTANDYRRIPHYGHSRPSDAVDICREAGAKRLVLFHHAPERSDAEIDRILADTRALAEHEGRRAGGFGRLRGVGRRDREGLMEISFWGVRGSIPAPGPATVRYGGNTSCVSLRPGGGGLIVLDCGTGARNLGMALMDGPFGKGHGEASILLSHAHWDHIQGFPFFVPLYQPGNKFHIYGGAQSSAMLEGILEGQMAPQYFPVQTLKNMGAGIDIAAIDEGKSIEVAGCSVRACTNPHGRAGRAGVPDRRRRALRRLRQRRRLRPGWPASRVDRALSRRRRSDPRQHLHAGRRASLRRSRVLVGGGRGGRGDRGRRQAAGPVPLRPGLQRRRGRRALYARTPSARRARRPRHRAVGRHRRRDPDDLGARRTRSREGETASPARAHRGGRGTL